MKGGRYSRGVDGVKKYRKAFHFQDGHFGDVTILCRPSVVRLKTFTLQRY